MTRTPSPERRAAYDAILSHALLTPEQERALARRIQSGDKSAKAELISHNFKLAASRAAHFAPRCRRLDFDDLFSAAYEGLDTAAARFDPERGFKFSTYAQFWIDHKIHEEIGNADFTIRPSQQATRDAGTLRRAEWLENQRSHRDVSDPELAEITGIKITEIARLRTIESMDSLDRYPTGSDAPLHETIADPRTEPEQTDPAFAELIARALSALPQQQREDVLALGVLEATPTTQGRRTGRSSIATARSYRAGLATLSTELRCIAA